MGPRTRIAADQVIEIGRIPVLKILAGFGRAPLSADKIKRRREAVAQRGGMAIAIAIASNEAFSCWPKTITDPQLCD